MKNASKKIGDVVNIPLHIIIDVPLKARKILIDEGGIVLEMIDLIWDDYVAGSVDHAKEVEDAINNQIKQALEKQGLINKDIIFRKIQSHTIHLASMLCP